MSRPQNLVQKILAEHLVAGDLTPGSEIAIKVDQTLTQDATGTLAYLQFLSLKVPRVQTELSVSYVDHKLLQVGFEDADDDEFLRTVAQKHGIVFSPPGNGICHQVHLERFSVPGKTLLGSDSHTTTCGGAGMLAIGVGGLDVALAMAGNSYSLVMPKVLHVRLTGALRPWCTAKDVILAVLRQLTVKGGVGYILEYGGPGIQSLDVPARSTITNMGAELGATTSVFPSDERTREYLHAQGRAEMWAPWGPDPDAAYDEVLDVDLATIEPLVARPHSPDNVTEARTLSHIKLNQVCVGSCTNSSYHDLMAVADILRGERVHPEVMLTVTPGSRQVLEMIARNGALADLIAAGARVLETACGPCIGMGQAPQSGGVTLRSFNRNFSGRTGTKDAECYLASPETCAVSALTGRITDPSGLGEAPEITPPTQYLVDDRMFIMPGENGAAVEVRQGPNIGALPAARPLAGELRSRVLLKVGDNITTDHILPGGERIMRYRSNVPKISEFTFEGTDPTFADRAKVAGGGIIVGGTNYGQGSSREHAALAPMYLGIRAVLAKSFARIHRDNLVNAGILPLVFADAAVYDRIEQGDTLVISLDTTTVERSDDAVVENETRAEQYHCRPNLSSRQIEIVRSGGLLNLIRSRITATQDGSGQ